MTEKPVLSVVLPVYNEFSTLPELHRRLSSVLDSLASPSEIVYVDDGSHDGSRERLCEFAAADSRVRVICFSRNFGHQAALFAGLCHARGKAVVLIDSDLQDPPEVIPEFVARWREGWDVVYAVRHSRKEGVFKRLAFALFYRLLNWLAAVRLPMDAGIFSLMDRRVVDSLIALPERNKYLSGLRAWVGFRQTGLPVERSARYEGEPRVTLSRLYKLAFDALFSFSYVPLRLSTLIGLTITGVSFLVMANVVYQKLVSHTAVLGWASTIVSVLFLGGVQLVTLGIIGEYLARVYDEVKQRPYFIVADRIGFPEMSRDRDSRPT